MSERGLFKCLDEPSISIKFLLFVFFFKEILVQDHFYRKYSLITSFSNSGYHPLLMMNEGATAVVCRKWAEVERETLCGVIRHSKHTLTFWMRPVLYGLAPFDDRVIGALFEWTLVPRPGLSLDCLSPHSEGAIFWLILNLHITPYYPFNWVYTDHRRPIISNRVTKWEGRSCCFRSWAAAAMSKNF